MGLIFTAFLKQTYTTFENVSNQYFLLPKKYLSTPFGLTDWNLVSGIIQEIKTPMGLSKQESNIIRELFGTEISLYLSPTFLGTDDFAYLSETSWTIIRDYGILPDLYYFTVNLKEIIKEEGNISIYPKRDVVVS